MRRLSSSPGPTGFSTVPVEPVEPAEVLDVDGFLTLARELTAAQQAPGAVTLCAVLGRPVAHSLSPVIHLSAARHLPGFRYVRVEAGDEREIRRLLAESPPCVGGFSVTMPGKPHALTAADESTDRAARIGSANTLVPLRDHPGVADGRWRADNTDVVGVSTCLDAVLGDRVPVRAAVVGNGGTARPTVAAFAARGVQHVEVVARSDRALALRDLVLGYGMEFSWTRLDAPDLAAVCRSCDVLVSTVPEAAAGERAGDLARAGAVIDVIYDPYPTRLLTAAQQTGRRVADGLLMLAGQGAEQFRQFTGEAVPAQTMYRALEQHLGLIATPD